MAKYFLITTLCLFAIIGVFGKSDEEGTFFPPNYKDIEVAVNNFSSPYYYPTLYGRYTEGDTTLTFEDYRHLYYGFIFDVRYNPFHVSQNEDSLMMVLQRNVDDRFISPELFSDISRISEKLLLENPYNLNVLNILTFVEQMSGNIEKAENLSYKMAMIKKVILSSGSGMHKNSPWYVISRADETAIVGSLGVKVIKTSYSTIDLEYMMLEKPFMGAKGLYFNIEPIWTKTPERKERSGNRFEINPTLNPRSDRYIKPTL